MKTITIDQHCDIVNKITIVGCFYRGKTMFGGILESHETLENCIFPHLIGRGFTHWKSSNGLINRKLLG